MTKDWGQEKNRAFFYFFLTYWMLEAGSQLFNQRKNTMNTMNKDDFPIKLLLEQCETTN